MTIIDVDDSHLHLVAVDLKHGNIAGAVNLLAGRLSLVALDLVRTQRLLVPHIL